MTIKKTLLENIAAQINAQTDKGIKKYGHSLDDCEYSKYDWLEMANQELIDLAQYQQKEIKRLNVEQKYLMNELAIVGWSE